MATQTLIKYVCDLSHEKETEATHRKVPLVVNGEQVELDMCDNHEKRLRDAVRDFLNAGRKVKGATSGPRRRTAKRATSPVGTSVTSAISRNGQSSSNGSPANGKAAVLNGKRTVIPPSQEVIRHWAQSQKLPVKDRGRIKKEIVDQYMDAHA